MSNTNTNPCPQHPGDGHTSPCPWTRAIMWVAGILIGLGIWTMGSLSGRVGNVEKQVGDMRELLAGMRSSIEYIQRDLSDIKATLRRDEVRKMTP